jgi:hypothetical protein
MNIAQIFVDRMREFLSEEEMCIFAKTPQYRQLVIAVNKGWPFMFSKRNDGNYILIIEQLKAAKHP